MVKGSDLLVVPLGRAKVLDRRGLCAARRNAHDFDMVPLEPCFKMRLLTTS
jgi:hypothetical protein